ncbi:TerB family tellurite resistance protein [Zavarzinia sp. CC-PAN008]|uniref:tellurite resistance TerB family protein n=1 Tax=Zavarzinia sp. CC-PAN008 TaxID=3243332 RepID=UPI003F746A31
MPIRRLKDMIHNFFTPDADREAFDHDVPTIHLAAGALLCEVLVKDGDVEDVEYERLIDLLAVRFGLSTKEVRDLLDTIRVCVDHEDKLGRMINSVRDNFNDEERVELLEMMADIAWQDSDFHAMERALICTVAERLGFDVAHGHRAMEKVRFRHQMMLSGQRLPSTLAD